jgi:hypothetical protein
VNLSDIIDAILGKKDIPSEQFDDYDTNGDGIVDIADAVNKVNS